MLETVLRTKLYIPPLRPNLVHRPRLIEQLNEGLHRKLTLISAPAGFGKTTLVSEWLAGSQRPAAWLSLDKGDNDPSRFLTYIVAALQTLTLSEVEGTAPAVGEGVLAALQSPHPPPTESILTVLLNEITALPHDIILVLDDYHVIDALPVSHALNFLLEHLPPQIHLVIGTREDPPLPLARYRGRDQLSELRVSDLRFTNSEAAGFLNQVMGLDLSPEDVAALETRTEGWIAGLQLAAISMRGLEDVTSFIHSFTGSHHFVLDYLLEEVLQQQPASIQTFFLRTSLLDRLCGPLCDAVVRDPTVSGQETLEYLEQANLFIVPLDNERRWYRYHHLFSDLLRLRLQQTQLEQIPMLHIRASEWNEQNGFDDEAIEYALRAEDFGRAAKQIERIAEAIWASGANRNLRRWLAKLPVELLFSKPQLCIFHAWYLIAGGSQGAADRVLQAAELALETNQNAAGKTTPQEPDQPHDVNTLTLRGRILTTYAFSAFYRGDVAGIIQHSRQALEYLSEQDLSWRSTAVHLLGDAYDFSGEMVEARHFRLKAVEASRASGNNLQIVIANLKLAVTLRYQGRLQQVIEICRQQLELANRNGMVQTDVVGWLLAIWGEALAETNDLGGALQKANKGVELTGRGGDLAMQGWSYLCLIRILFSRGDITSAEEIVHKIERLTQNAFVPPWIMNLNAAWQARLWLAQGKLETASQWAKERGLDAAKDRNYLHEIETIVFARILVAYGQLEEAATLLQHQLEAAEEGGRTSRIIEILMLQALTLQARGDTAQAVMMLEQALTLAEPGGFIRIFVDEGAPMKRQLSAAAARGIMPDYTQQLLAAFEAEEQKDEDRSYLPTPPPAQPLIEPLSPRELEVLQLIAQGLSNREIGERLFLALNTVKGHNRNIFEKLQVHRRTEAVARARALGLL